MREFVKKNLYAKISRTSKRSFHLVLWQEEWLVGATPFTWNFGSNWPDWSENARFSISIHS